MRPFALLLVCLCVAAGAQGDERTRIADERRALDARYDAELRACHERFVVTSCVDDARLRWRQAMAPLRERELELDAQGRQRRADARRADLSHKQTQAAGRAASASDRPQRGPRPAHGAASGAAGADGAIAMGDRGEARARANTDEARERAQAARKQQDEVAAAQRRVAERERQRAAKGKASAPLPVPASVPAR